MKGNKANVTSSYLRALKSPAIVFSTCASRAASVRSAERVLASIALESTARWALAAAASIAPAASPLRCLISASRESLSIAAAVEPALGLRWRCASRTLFRERRRRVGSVLSSELLVDPCMVAGADIARGMVWVVK